MSFQKAALSNLGGVEMQKGDFRAHLQFRDEEGTKTHVRGPPRATEREAYADLEAIRASGGLGNTRGESLRIMMAEASQQKATADDYKRLREMGHGSVPKNIKVNFELILNFATEMAQKCTFVGRPAQHQSKQKRT